MSDDLGDLRRRLETISEELADLALALLHQAIEDDAPAPAAQERRLTRARRAVDKAAMLLSPPAESTDGEGEGA